MLPFFREDIATFFHQHKGNKVTHLLLYTFRHKITDEFETLHKAGYFL